VPDEEFGAGGDELRGFGAEEGFGEGGHAGRVVRYECGCGAGGFDVQGGELVEEAGEGG